MGELTGSVSERQMGRGRATILFSPRFLLLAGGTLAFTLACWFEVAVDDSRNRVGTLVMLLLLLMGLALLLRAVTMSACMPAAAAPRWSLRAVAFSTLGLLLLSVVLTVGLAGSLLIQSATSPRIYDSDAAAFNHYNAALVLQGVNPYTADSHFWDALRQFPTSGATPLRAGRYAHLTYGPSAPRLVADVQTEIAQPAQRGPEFSAASLHSYPALAFLVYVPGVWLGLGSTLLTSLVLLGAFLVAVAWGVPRGLLLPVWVLLLANQFVVLLTLRGSFDVVALLPALLAWRTLDRRWLSPLLLGIACAVKQLVWPLVPFYVILVWRREGASAAAKRLVIASVAFLLPNLPFLMSSPRAWVASMLLPMTLPIFPSGIGLVALARAQMMPLLPAAAYTALELLALAALLLWFARARAMPRPELALLVGLLPFLLAWHSVTAYFVAIPALAVYAALPLLRQEASSTGCVTEQDETVVARTA